MNHSDALKITDFLNNGNVVIIEPTSNYRKTLQRYISNLKVKSLKIYDRVPEAKADMAFSKTSLLIVEWQQKEQNGVQFCREIRHDRKHKETPYMLLSTEALRADVVLASEVGIDGYLLKPFSYEDFCEQLTSLVKKSQERVRYQRLIEQAEKLLEQDKYGDAEKLFVEGQKHQFTTARALLGLGRIRLAEGLQEAAISRFKQAIEANGAYLEAYRCIIDVFRDREQAHHVLHYALRAHEISPDNPRYMLNIASAYLSIGDLEKSEAFFRRVIRISPSLAEAHKGLGDLRMLQEDYERAMGCYQKALDLDGEDVSILNSMGLVFVKQSKYPEGIKKYKLALAVEPDNAKVLFNIGYANEKMGQLPEARDFYNQALICEPDFDKPQRGLMRVTGAIKRAN